MLTLSPGESSPCRHNNRLENIADATVTDEGTNYRGTAEIRAWMARVSSECTYIAELLCVTGELDVGMADLA